MKNTIMLVSASMVCALLEPTQAVQPARDQLGKYASEAISDDSTRAAEAIAALRAAGPVGLDTLWAVHADRIARKARDVSWERLSAAIDQVAKQKDAAVSKLFWYTDFEQARQAAAAQGKPILSLRLLGNLDEELSCANSRFFRTVLYANTEVSDYLRSHFVLHWKSVRPVPKVTIDFGDGRTLERTITGNSIHYILDSNGRPIDALPGLYGPQAFVRALQQAEQVADLQTSSTELTAYHSQRLKEIRRAWNADLLKVGGNVPQEISVAVQPTAQAASRLAIGKGAVEAPMIEKITEKQPIVSVDDQTWAKIAALHVNDARLDEDSRQLMRAKNPTAWQAGPLTMSKARIEDPMLRMIRNFERSIAEDTVRNEYVLHRRIHQWFISGQAMGDVDALNERVYAEIFLTPSSDPWLGLAPQDTYTALEGRAHPR